VDCVLVDQDESAGREEPPRVAFRLGFGKEPRAALLPGSILHCGLAHNSKIDHSTVSVLGINERVRAFEALAFSDLSLDTNAFMNLL
jgi:hypothetical protein